MGGARVQDVTAAEGLRVEVGKGVDNELDECVILILYYNADHTINRSIDRKRRMGRGIR